jgi:hypothetical protein
LETYRLTPAGGQQRQRIVAQQNGFDDLLLHRPEAVVLPVLFKDFVEGHSVATKTIKFSGSFCE